MKSEIKNLGVKELLQFLSNEGLSRAFKSNFEDNKINPYKHDMELLEYLSRHADDACEAIYGAFLWSKSPEGLKFWSEVNKKFMQYNACDTSE